MTAPKVTVLMPVYNGEKFLKESIESILLQTFSDFEFLIINDGSVDSSHDIILSYTDDRIRYVRNKINIGLNKTLNKGIDLAKGIYIARMDQDDISLPKRLSKQILFLEQNLQYGLCGTWVITFGDILGDIWRYPTNPDTIRSRLLFDCPIAHPSVMIRKEFLKQYSLCYDNSMKHMEDWDLWQRCSKLFPICNIPDILLKYRISQGSITKVYNKEQIKNIRFVHKRNIIDLGIKFSEQEIDIHSSIGSWQYQSDITYLESCSNWLIKLKNANEDKHEYPEPAFSNFLAEKWYSICKKATKNGMQIWYCYWQSPLSKLINLRITQRVRFLISCILHKDRL